MINNFPTYANEYKYIVARRVDGELWFWALGMTATRQTKLLLRLAARWSLMSDHQIKKIFKRGLTKTGTSVIIKSSKERRLKQ